MALKRFSLRPTGWLTIGQMEHRLADFAARGWLLCGANSMFDLMPLCCSASWNALVPVVGFLIHFLL